MDRSGGGLQSLSALRLPPTPSSSSCPLRLRSHDDCSCSHRCRSIRHPLPSDDSGWATLPFEEVGAMLVSDAPTARIDRVALCPLVCARYRDPSSRRRASASALAPRTARCSRMGCGWAASRPRMAPSQDIDTPQLEPTSVESEPCAARRLVARLWLRGDSQWCTEGSASRLRDSCVDDDSCREAHCCTHVLDRCHLRGDTILSVCETHARH